MAHAAAVLADELRLHALVRALVEGTTGLMPSSGETHEAAVDWVHGSFRHHRFGSTDGHAVSRDYAQLVALLRRHSRHDKASDLDALASKLEHFPCCDATPGTFDYWFKVAFNTCGC